MGFADTLNAVQDQVFANKAYWPKEEDGDEITFCNVASLAVANGVECHDFDPMPGAQPLRADEIYHLLVSSKLFIPTRMAMCQALVNEGNLILAIAPSWNLHQGEGHVCTLTPGVGDFSGRWNSFTPLCMNLGRSGTCSRRRGVNWAFQIVPEFYRWAPIPAPLDTE